MKFSILKQHLLQALVAFPLLICTHGAALAAPAPPAALATLDVCHNEATGNWRYSGMVAVSGRDLNSSAVIGVDYLVQNNTSTAGYASTLQVPAILDDVALATASKAHLTRFSTEGTPMSLGTVSNTSRVAIADPLALSAAPLVLTAGAGFAEAVCGCPKPTGCTRTQGYWKSKPGVVWPAPYSRTAMFFSSGLTWQQILGSPPSGGNAYLILAHQYIAALLNRASGASAPSSLQTVISDATTWFSGGTNLDSCGGSACETQKNRAGMLDTYNNGLYPGAPSHCRE